MEKLAFANQKTLAARLEEVIETNRQEVCKLTANVPDFSSKVRHTRNYFTHYDTEALSKAR